MSKDNDDKTRTTTNNKDGKMERKNCDESQHPTNNKKAKTTCFEDVLGNNVLTEEREKSLQESYLTATPYKHARIENIFQVDFLTACKEQIKQNSKVNFKETDLFRVYQSIDLANLEPNSELALKMPAVMQLRHVLYSQEWRSFMERVTQLPPGTLNNQVDCACNCHAPGCHLLCHDDVIGTRKISYILYLTEPDWKEEEGGALELYDSYVTKRGGTAGGSSPSANAAGAEASDSNDATRREPETCPSKTLVPLFNSMAFFVVEPGVSFHAVQEVLGERPRLSVQGWYHAASVPDHIENATLSRLKEQPSSGKNKDKKETTSTDNSNDNNADDDPFIPLKDERVQPLEQQRKQRAANADKLLDSDRDYLALYVNETYLTKAAMEDIRQRFEEDSSVQLCHFFRTSWVNQVKKAITGHDLENRPSVGEEGYYQWGATDEWKLIGPPHKQRYLRYQEQDESSNTDGNNGRKSQDPIAMALPPQTTSAGHLMALLKQKVMQSPAFGRYLNYITSLGVPRGYKGQIRRFRPGLDYTVAHYGILTQKAVLDATVCFAAGTGGLRLPENPVNTSEEADTHEAKDKNESSKTVEEDDNVSNSEEEELDESDMLWQSDDVGGFECYIEADDYENSFTRDGDGTSEDDEGGKKGVADAAGAAPSDPAEEYNADDDTNLLSVSASNNTLSLVYRDPGTMRFIKYVGSRAPSSRWDISMEYQVPDDDK